MPKELHFHADHASATVFVNGVPVTLSGEISIAVKQPTKMSRSNKQGWAMVAKENASAVSCEIIEAAP